MSSSLIAFLNWVTKWLREKTEPLQGGGRKQQSGPGMGCLYCGQSTYMPGLKGAGNHSLILLKRWDSSLAIQANMAKAGLVGFFFCTNQPFRNHAGEDGISWIQVTRERGSWLPSRDFPGESKSSCQSGLDYNWECKAAQLPSLWPHGYFWPHSMSRQSFQLVSEKF